MGTSRDGRYCAWAVTWGLRAAFTACGALFLVMGALPWSDTSSYLEGWPTRLSSLGIGIAFFVVAYRPRLELKGDLIVARGIVFSKQIPLTELIDARPGYYGITLTTRDGRGFTPTFVGEKSNLRLILGRRGRADEIATTLLAAVRPDFAPGRRRRDDP
jgi:hypothetical protein